MFNQAQLFKRVCLSYVAFFLDEFAAVLFCIGRGYRRREEVDYLPNVNKEMNLKVEKLVVFLLKAIRYVRLNLIHYYIRILFFLGTFRTSKFYFQRRQNLATTFHSLLSKTCKLYKLFRTIHNIFISLSKISATTEFVLLYLQLQN